MTPDGREGFAGVLRFYELAKRQEWQVRDLPWGEIPPIPEARAGVSPEKKERRQAVWRSVITQQLQADELAPEPDRGVPDVGEAPPRLDPHDHVHNQIARMSLFIEQVCRM